MSRIDFQQVCKRYPNAKALTIKNANLQIEQGEFCVFVGPSGCGKSTLLRMVAGLEEISSGDVLINGKRVNDLPAAERGVAMVFQSYALYPHMSVFDNMAFGLKTAGAKKAEIARKVQTAAESLQLTALLDRLPQQLSGGQRQRVAIGRAIVKQPAVFLFDEPLSNLDAALRVQTRLEIAKLHQRMSHASMIYVTHDQVEAMTLADKIVLLRAGPDVQTLGSIAQVGTPLALYHRPASRFVAEFIGSPKMNIFPAKLLSSTQHKAECRLGAQTFTAQVHALAAGADVTLGIRPEDMELCAGPGDPAASSNCLMGHIEHIERLGEASLLYLRCAGAVQDALELITVKAPGTVRHQVGDNITVHCPEAALHCFDVRGNAFERTAVLPQM